MDNTLINKDIFSKRHNGPNKEQVQEMLDQLGLNTLDELIEQTLPQSIRSSKPLQLPPALTEFEFLKSFKETAQKNKIFKSYIGMGYYDCITPTVIQRNILENPGWYTAYTPYQAEIAQGRLEALVNFQTMVIDLTGMEIANASLLDEATAAAEAMSMLYHSRKRKNAHTFFVSDQCFPQTIDVLCNRAEPLGIQIKVGKHESFSFDQDIFGMLLQYPALNGEVNDYTALIREAVAQDLHVVVAADLLSLTLLKAPGEMGADVVVGSTQRLGIPMGYGGPHAAYFATLDKYKRNIPGRIIGASIDQEGNPAYRMALQTREQHIRREKATSNICTSQVLLAVMAGAYAVYHGPAGLKGIASRIHQLTCLLSQGFRQLKFKTNTHFFDTLFVEVSQELRNKVKESAEKRKINFNYFSEGFIGISIDETTTLSDVYAILDLFAEATLQEWDKNLLNPSENAIPQNLIRTSPYLQHEVFHQYHAEHEMLRYLKRLENKDLSLAHSMISLGSCTMKLNATTEMIPVTWPEMSNIHPFAPMEQTEAYQEMIGDLETFLSEITGFDAVSFQPNSGAQGEYAGLLVIRNYHIHQNNAHRNIVLIPSSAHGTNPASAIMAGMRVVVVACDEQGNIDLEDLKQKAEAHKEYLSALMITYPSTHGVFEKDIMKICKTVHDFGGQVYMDGANMNAQVGLTNPALIGADVCHLNLHKTFCIPHGGGGPGMGPIGVKKHLVPFLPGHFSQKGKNNKAVAAAPYGSASILPISYAYIRMMGAEGLTEATKIAILNANYLKNRLEKHYDILYSGEYGRVAHEMIIDCRPFKAFDVQVEDIAKRLMDYGYHAPTISFPVAGTMMVEPTESETKAELDRFCEALIAIRQEITEIEKGQFDSQNNVLKNAPHTLNKVISGEWTYPYSREKAVFPLPYVKSRKFWPSSARIDNAYGDRNLVCSCLPMEAYHENEFISQE